MGAGQSKAGTTEQVFRNEIPIQFSPDLVNTLADRLETTETTAERQSVLDTQVRNRIQSDMARIRETEDSVLHDIARVLERENLEHERAMAGEASDGANIAAVKSSAALMQDLIEIKQKVDKFRSRKELQNLPDVKSASEAVALCYKRVHSTTPLNCWREVAKFKATVAQAENEYYESLR
ncbi:hypothetical protein FISHEDRAFT_38462 [Fistulina hepatica ATCC 64428]|nr:hypothetical protein FISHEDRAFT_38462 [Fistulina hepatica ATCC 64428]